MTAITLSCRDVDEMLDAFVDSELPPASLLDVARHAAHCAPCEARIESLTSVSHMVGETIRGDAATLDLSGVWAAVERRIVVVDEQQHRLHRWDRVRRAFSGPTLPAWGTAVAIAASAVIYLQQPALQRGARTDTMPRRGVINRVSYIPPRPSDPNKASLNQALIERIKGSNVRVQRLPKDGTTAIWVSYSPDGAR